MSPYRAHALFFILSMLLAVLHHTSSASLRIGSGDFPLLEQMYEQKDQQRDQNDFEIAAVSKRNGVEGIECPQGMSEYECYHELMAVWMRVLRNKENRMGKRW